MHPDPHPPAGPRRTTDPSPWGYVLPLAGALIAGVVVVGRLAGAPLLTRLGPYGFPAATMLAGSCLLLVSIAVILAAVPGARIPTLITAGAAGGVAVVALIGWMAGFRLPGVPAAGPGYAAPWTMVAVLLLAVVLVTDRRVQRVTGQAVLTAVLAMVVIGLVLVAFQAASPSPRLPSEQMAVPSALALLALVTGMMLRVPDRGLVGLLHAPGPGGRMARWLLPGILLFALGAGGTLYALLRHGVLSLSVAWASFVVSGMLLPAGIIGALAIALERSEQHRRRAEDAGLAAERARVEALEAARLRLATSDARARALIDNAPDAIVVLDVDLGRFVDANPEAERLFGLDRAALLARGPVDVSPATQPDGRDSAAAVAGYVEQALAGGTPVFEWTHLTGSGGSSLSEVRLLRLPGERRLVRGSLIDIGERRTQEIENTRLAAAQAATEVESVRLARAHARAHGLAEERALLLLLSTRLGRAADLNQVGRTVVSTVAGALGAGSVSIWWMRDAGSPLLLATTGPAGLDAVAAEVVERRDLVLVPAGAVSAGDPAGDDAGAGDSGTDDAGAGDSGTDVAGTGDGGDEDSGADGGRFVRVGMPLLVDNRMVGLAAFGWSVPRRFGAADRELLYAVAAHCATALDRARLFDAERDARSTAERAQQRLSTLAEGGALLADSTDETVLRNRFAEFVATRYGCWAAVVLEPDEEGFLRTTAAHIADPGFASLAAALPGSALADLADDDVRARAYRNGRPARTDDSGTATAVLPVDDPDLARRLAPVRFGAVLAVPVVARSDTIGLIVAIRAAGAPPFTDHDQEVIGELARRAGAKLDNLRLLAARTEVAVRLQRALLPPETTSLPNAEIAVRYLVGDEGAEVGGDFYDAFPVGPDEYALIIGDVCGRGVDAAGLTGFARATLRAVAGDLPPAGALHRLNELLIARGDAESLITVAYLRLRLCPDGAGELTACLAGHPAPYLARPGQPPQPLGEPGLVLGVLAEPVFTERTVNLAPGDLLVLYTDGIVEAKGPDGLFGTRRLVDLIGRTGGSAEAVASQLENALLAYRDRGGDDTALLVLHLLEPTEAGEQCILDLHLPADVTTVRGARVAAVAAVRGYVGTEVAADVAIGVSELVTNAVRQLQRHPTRTLRPDPIQLRILRRAASLRIEVHNPGPTFTPPAAGSGPLAESGRGLAVVRSLFDGIGVDTSSGNTAVWFELPRTDDGRADAVTRTHVR